MCGGNSMPKKVVEKTVEEKKEKGKFMAKCPFCGDINLRKGKHCEHFSAHTDGKFIFKNTEYRR